MKVIFDPKLYIDIQNTMNNAKISENDAIFIQEKQ